MDFLIFRISLLFSGEWCDDGQMTTLAHDPALRRRVPAQARSRATVDRVCAAATVLLSESGWSGLNTNAVAARAGVSVTAVYSYFPDKYAIVHELSQRYTERRLVLLRPSFVAIAGGIDLGAWLTQAMTAMAQMRVDYPEGVILRATMQASHELRDLQQVGTMLIAVEMAGALQERDAQMAPAHALHIARTLLTSAVAMIDDCTVWNGSVMEVDDLMVAESILMISLYLADALTQKN